MAAAPSTVAGNGSALQPSHPPLVGESPIPIHARLRIMENWSISQLNGFVTLAMLFTSLSFINNNSTQHTEYHKILHLWDCQISGLIRDLNLDPFRRVGL